MNALGKLVLKGLELLGITNIGSTYTGYKSLFINSTTNKVALGDVPTGATVYSGESAGITGSLSGNTYYNEVFTVTGAVVGDNVHTNINDAFLDDLVGTGQEGYTVGKVTSADTVTVYFRVDSFINENTNRKVWAEIIK